MTARLAILALLIAVAAAPAAARHATLDSLLAATAADSLVAPLRALENDRAQPHLAIEASMLLGQLHYARGEYRQAADAFTRAAARLDPAEKPEARYWAGLAWLGLGDSNQARAALEEVVRSDSPRRAGAMLGVAQAWAIANRPDRALEQLDRLLARAPGEAGPAALQLAMALELTQNRPDAARQARDRLLRAYPQSIEAARARLDAARPLAVGPAGAVGVQLGAFADPARARSLAEAARRAGFGSAQVTMVGEGAARLHIVRLGIYPSADAARRAGDEAARALGLTYQIVSAP